LVVKLSIFTVEKISLHKFGIEFNQKFNGDVRIRIMVKYDVVRTFAKNHETYFSFSGVPFSGVWRRRKIAACYHSPSFRMRAVENMIGGK
jgi:hypothetical protein